jgi:hypothetical protein
MDKRKDFILSNPLEDPPPLGEGVITKKFRCCGYIDDQRTWHHIDLGGTPIEDVIGWLPVHRQPPLNVDHESRS